MAEALLTYDHADFPVERLLADRGEATVSVCVPARQCAPTIVEVVTELVALRAAGAIDEVVVIDAGSEDGTAQLAAHAGADVHQEDELMPGVGPVLGKGDAMWRGLSVLEGDVVCFVDGDTEGFDGHFVRGLVGPLLAEPAIAFVKGAYRRPFRAGSVTLPEGGGRVNELVARPLLRRFWPALAEVRQPLAGEIAARRSLLERMPFSTGYAVEIAMLIDAHDVVGPGAIAESDIGERLNAHQPLSALGSMADEVLAAITARLAREGRLRRQDAGEVVERPPIESLLQDRS